MRKLSKKILFYYCTLFSITVAVSGIILNLNSERLVFQLVFLPVPLFFITLLVSELKRKNTNTEGSRTNPIGVATVLILFLLLFGIGFYNAFTARPIQKVTTEKKQTSQITTPTPTIPKERILIVKTDFESSMVNIREEASKSAKIVAKIQSGKNFTILSEEEGWYKIQLNKEETGWINKELVEIQ
jgi:hypothetical protein